MKIFFRKLIASLVVGLAAFLIIFAFSCLAVKITVFVVEFCRNYGIVDVVVTLAIAAIALLFCIIANTCGK